MRVATIDIGSNSILLLIAEKKNGSIHILYDEARVVGLAKKLGQKNEITKEALERAREAIKFYAATIRDHSPDKIIAVTTEALRKASNGSQVRDELAKELGHPIDIIEGDREAELSFWSVQKEHPKTREDKIVFDIGGASTELCLGNEDGIKAKTSLKFGSVFLTEKFELHKPSEMDECVKWIINELKEARFPKADLGIGVAGTVTSLFSIQYGLDAYHRDLVHKKSLPRESIEMICQSVLKMNVSQRDDVPGMPPRRADVIGGGFCILIALMRHFGWKEITCMDSGVRFGLLYEVLIPGDVMQP